MPALCAAAGSGEGAVRFFTVLGAMLVAGKFAGELFERLGQPPVLGELIVGILLGTSGLGVIPTGATDPLTPVIRLLAAVGIVVLLFEIGLATDLRAIGRVGAAAASVALVGVLVPFALGYAYWMSPLHAPLRAAASLPVTALFVGAALTATSIGISARVLAHLDCVETVEGRLILGAAVIDDVLGLVILGLVVGLAGGRVISALDGVRLFGVVAGFLVAALAVGLALARRLFALVERMRGRGVLVVSAFAFVLLLAVLADRAGAAPIIGAFAAGLVLAGTDQAPAIAEQMKPVADIFVPVFFLSIGAALDLRTLNPLEPRNLIPLGIAGVLLVIAVAGKLAAGWVAPWRRFNRWAVGLGMAPRGEVGIIFANVGLTTGALPNELFSAILLVVIATTLVTPPLLTWAFGRWGATLAAE